MGAATVGHGGAGLWRRAVRDALLKLNPVTLARNPVMFIVELGTVVTGLLACSPSLFGRSPGVGRGYDGAVCGALLLTVLFANFAEAYAEGRGRAQADALRRTRVQTMARRIDAGGAASLVQSGTLRRGQVVRVLAGETIPGDGDVVAGLASVDESAVTGESAPVIRGAGGDFSSVTGGTRVLSDAIDVRITSDPGTSFLDRMIALVEGAQRQKTPNEIALNVLLAGLTLIFVVVVVTLEPMAEYLGQPLAVASLIALLVALIPTTIGALLSAIGIAGMDRVLRLRVIAKSGRAVEAAGDVDTLILDKTGTITIGNRLATEFVAADGVGADQLVMAALWASLGDETPEGRSIVALARQQGAQAPEQAPADARIIAFSAETRRSGLCLPDGTEYSKGAVDAMAARLAAMGGALPPEMRREADRIGRAGGTPLAVAVGGRALGVVHLKDVVKSGLRQRFEALRAMGIRTVMVTGDNPLTAATVAAEAGVDDFVAEARPEDKMRLIRSEQAQGRLVAMTGDGTNDAPALAQADVGLAMNTGTAAAKEAGNMVDLDSDPGKLIDVVGVGKQLLITRGSITTFSIANDVSKYFAILPAMFAPIVPVLGALNIMHLTSPRSAILSAIIFNALVIPALIPLAMRGVRHRATGASALLVRNMLLYGLGGVALPFVAIKAIDLLLTALHLT